MNTLIRRLFLLITAITLFIHPVSASIPDGAWEGTLSPSPASKLRLVFHISGNDGHPSATMDSPDQGAFGIPAVLHAFDNDSVTLSIMSVKAKFMGRLHGTVIEGIFQQGVNRMPLTLQRADAPKRPQTPRPPFPYTEEEVTVTSFDGAKLNGTLTVPDKADCNTPLMIMVTGSGNQNRDEELFDHRPFAVIADHLARHGIATLRYDDRGTASSTGDLTQATTATFARDAKAVMDYVRKMNRFSRTGVLGHSEGAAIAFMLASEGDADMIVGLGTPTVRGDSILAYQTRHALLNSGVDPKDVDTYVQANLSNITNSGNPWLIYFASTSPAPYIASTDIPALAIYGGKDIQVSPDPNLEALKRINPRVDTLLFPDLNHMMQHATTGEVSEYATITETIAPEVLNAIVEFILKCH